VRGFFDALSLLTRVPTRAGADRQRAIAWFPVVGALIGGAGAAVYALARTALTPLVSATLTVAALALLTGALHEDGLADVADAFGSGGDKARTLEILDDPRLGTYGVLALSLSLIARVAAIGSLDGWTVAAVLPAAQALSRASASCVMPVIPPARPSGLGARYSAGVTPKRVLAGVSAAAVVSGALLGWWAIAATALALTVTAGVGALAARKIGGITGDVLGAAQQLSEIGILVLAVGAGGAFPWWR